MTLIALILCLFITAVAAVGVVSPPRLLGVLRKTEKIRGLIILGVLRVVLGIALIFSAPTSRAPELIGIVGVIVIIRGVTLPLIGVDRVRRLLEWVSAKGPGFLRGWALLAMGIGVWLLYALFP
jgi:hypothetical protein